MILMFISFQLPCFLQDRRTGVVIGAVRCRKSAPRLYILDNLCLPSSTTSPPHVFCATSVLHLLPSDTIVLVIYVALACQH
jgi:hypothetical protein